MPKRRNSIANSAKASTKNELTTPLRRSHRLLNHNPQDLNTNPPKTPKNSVQKPSNELRKASGTSSTLQTPLAGCRRSPRLISKSVEISIPRRSSRLSKQNNEIGLNKIRVLAPVELKDNDVDFLTKANRKASVGSCVQIAKISERRTQFHEIRSKKIGHSASVESKDKGGVFVNKVKRGSCDEIEQRIESKIQFCVNAGVVLGLQAVNRIDVFESSRKTRKRKRGEEDKKECVKGWTKEQEMALQRAYIVAKPTPNFWKKVSKLVPGKSAKDCFDRVHADHITPTQPLPRSRAKNIDSSPLGRFSLSASKLLESSSLKAEKLSRNKRKSHIGIAHKTVRQLLQKHNSLDLNCEADLFSVLEPNENNIVSTPKQLQDKHGILQPCLERSSQKKPTRFRNLSERDIVSPPVLKQVKNKALHEKYIDQLHSREAKRKSIYFAGKENNIRGNIPKTDMVRAAKNALVSDAVNAISTLQHLRTNPKGDSSDCDGDDGLDMDNDEIDGL